MAVMHYHRAVVFRKRKEGDRKSKMAPATKATPGTSTSETECFYGDRATVQHLPLPVSADGRDKKKKKGWGQPVGGCRIMLKRG